MQMASHSSELNVLENSPESSAANEMMETESGPSCRKRAGSESTTAAESKLVRLEIENPNRAPGVSAAAVALPKSMAVIGPLGFLSTGKETTGRNSRNTDPCEEMMLYNRRKATLALVSSDAILSTQSIKQPLARTLCIANCALIRNDRVFVSMLSKDSHVIQVYNLHEGNLLKEIENSALPKTTEVLLNSTGNRIYAANYGGRAIFEVYQNGRLRKVAEVKSPIWNFWVEHQDESFFMCTYVQVYERQPLVYIRFKANTIEQKLQRDDIADYMIIGRSAGRCYLLQQGQHEIAVIYRNGETYEFCLDGAIDSVFSLNHCGNLIYILKRDKIFVIDTETKRRHTIDGIQGTDEVDEECQLIRRITTRRHRA